jgi:transcriptional regulator with XRE-family HTH domain
MNKFRENLRNELDFQNLRVKELSDKCDIPKATIECYLRTHSTEPSVENALKIAHALGVSVEYLVAGEDDISKNLQNSNREVRELIRRARNLSSEQCKAILSLIKSFQESASVL